MRSISSASSCHDLPHFRRRIASATILPRTSADTVGAAFLEAAAAGRLCAGGAARAGTGARAGAFAPSVRLGTGLGVGAGGGAARAATGAGAVRTGGGVTALIRGISRVVSSPDGFGLAAGAARGGCTISTVDVVEETGSVRDGSASGTKR